MVFSIAIMKQLLTTILFAPNAKYRFTFMYIHLATAFIMHLMPVVIAVRDIEPLEIAQYHAFA